MNEYLLEKLQYSSKISTTMKEDNWVVMKFQKHKPNGIGFEGYPLSVEQTAQLKIQVPDVFGEIADGARLCIQFEKFVK